MSNGNSHLPRVPVRFIPENQELLKSHAGQFPSDTDRDANPVETVPEECVQSHRNRVSGRPTGNVIFRRYPDGKLDIQYAKHQVIDAIHRLREGGVLNGMEESALSCCFPASFDFVDSSMVSHVMRTSLKITDAEGAAVAFAVAEHLAAEINYKNSNHSR